MTDLDQTLQRLEATGVVLWRDADGAHASLPQRIVHHSPTGFAWGYSGSGPADLALNIVELALHALGYAGRRIDVYQGDCFALAWELHQEFKTDYVAQVPEQGATLPWNVILAWVQRKAGLRLARSQLAVTDLESLRAVADTLASGDVPAATGLLQQQIDALETRLGLTHSPTQEPQP